MADRSRPAAQATAGLLDDTPAEAATLAAAFADLLGDTPAWHELALCAQTDPEAFFPEIGQSTRDAKRVCTRCEVRADCLEYALEHDERFGVWGGLSERQRRRLARK